MKKQFTKNLKNLRKQIQMATKSKEVISDFDEIVEFTTTNEEVPYFKWLDNDEDLLFFIEEIARNYAGLSEREDLSVVARDTYIKNFSRTRK